MIYKAPKSDKKIVQVRKRQNTHFVWHHTDLHRSPMILFMPFKFPDIQSTFVEMLSQNRKCRDWV